MDRLILHKIRIPIILGILPEERLNPQDVVFDVEAEIDIIRAAASDDIDNADVNYRILYDKLVRYVSDTEFMLIETLADKTAAMLLDTFAINSLKLTVTKHPSDMRDMGGVSIVVER